MLNKIKQAMCLAGASVALSGCFVQEGSFVINEELTTVTFPNGEEIEFTVGVGSGAYHRPGDSPRIFYTVTDRGPNIGCDDSADIIGIENFCSSDEDGKIFPVADFTPAIYKIRIDYNRRTDTMDYKVLRTIELKDSAGQPISGITNPFTSTDTENAYDKDGNLIAFDPNGVDTEALVLLRNNTFWVAEEYGPSLLHVAADGTILERVVPAGLETDLANATYPVSGKLPGILAKRKLNRGIESIAVSRDQKFLYAALQSPLANPDGDAYKASANVRILKMSLNRRGEIVDVVGEYVYRLDTAQTFANKATGEGDLKNDDYRAQKDVKVSEMLALGQDDLIILERISKVTKLYRVDLATGDNILASEWDDLATSPSLEEIYDTAAVNAKPVAKALAFNSLTDGPAGTLPTKVEGLAMLDDQHLLMINDNDFGIEGKDTVAVILPIVEDLKAVESVNFDASFIGRYESGVFDDGAAEIVAYDAANQKAFVVNSNDAVVDVLDMADPTQPTLLTSIDVKTAAADIGGANSVAVYGDLLAVAIEADTKQDDGFVGIYSTNDHSLLKLVEVGALPDMVTFTPDGQKILTANEGEPNDEYTNDPEGSVSIIDISAGVANATVLNVGFTEFNVGEARHGELDADVRIFGLNASVAQDLEPEYIAVSADSAKAYVALQENNALAIIDISNASIDGIKALGFKDYSKVENALDTSDKDDAIQMRSWDNLVGMYQPDAIAGYEFAERTYIVSANEGDSRDYDAFSEETRVEDLADEGLLSAELVANADRELLGRMKVTTANGADENGIFNTLFSYGARSFSIWDDMGNRVFDSLNGIEQVLAQRLPEFFNTTNDETKFDNRSDDKGAEPEGVTVGVVNGRTLAFVGLERMGGIMIYDITSPYGVQFVDYLNSRNYEADPETSEAGDLAPEGLTFVAAEQSPTGEALLIVGNEVSGTTSVYEIK